MSSDSGIDIRSFRPGFGETAADPATTDWLEATALVFQAVPPTPAHARRIAQAMAADDRVLTGAYDDSAHPLGWARSRPIATLATFRKDLNVGDGRMLEAHLIADVTVRPTHRRRGLMRELLTADLRRAAGDGVAVSALHAQEATIYGRFGFGPATFGRRVDVEVSDRFQLTAQPTGEVEIVDAATLAEWAPRVFDRYHARTTGSLRERASFASRVSGAWAEDDPQPAPGLRAAIHIADDGTVDGFVTHRFDGWEPRPRSMTVVDFVAASDDARLGLWRYLAAIDLVEVVKTVDAPVDDPLPWALEDRRVYSVVGEEDGLWLRILDAPRALEGRAYDADGSITIELTDPLGIAQGVYRVDVDSGRAAVTRAAPGSAAAKMDVAALGSLFLGGVDASMLQRSGRLLAAPTTARELDRILRHREAPACLTGF